MRWNLILKGNLLLALVAICLDTAAATQWTKEPTVVMGIPLGATLSDSGLPECRKDYSSGDAIYRSKPGDPLCFKRPRFATEDDSLSLDNIPFESASSPYNSMKLIDDRIASILLFGGIARFDEALLAMKERYGAPSLSTSRLVQTRIGANYSSRQLLWRGRAVSIELTERCGDIETFCVQFWHHVTASRKDSKRDSKVKAQAEKL